MKLGPNNRGGSGHGGQVTGSLEGHRVLGEEVKGTLNTAESSSSLKKKKKKIKGFCR